MHIDFENILGLKDLFYYWKNPPCSTKNTSYLSYFDQMIIISNEKVFNNLILNYIIKIRQW